MRLISGIKRLLFRVPALLIMVSCQSIGDAPLSHPVAAPPSGHSSADCRTVRHAMGATEICGQPQRIVVLGPYLLEQVLALGAQPAGYADHMALHQGDYTDPPRQIPYLGDRVTTHPVNVGLAYQPSIEGILRVQPDLILTPDYNTGHYGTLSGIAPTLVFDVDGGETHLREIGQALNQADRAEKLIHETENRVKTAQTDFAPVVANRPDVLMLTSENAQTFSLISHSNSFCGSLVKELGFQLLYPEGLSDAEISTPATISVEALPGLNTADSIILLGFNWDLSKQANSGGAEFKDHQLEELEQAWEENAIAQSLDASQAGRVYFIPAYLCLGLPGPIGTELYLKELENQLLTPQQQTP